MEKAKLSELTQQFQKLFIDKYKDTVSKHYSQHRFKFPINKGYNVKVVTVNETEAIELIFILSNDLGTTSYNYYALELREPQTLNISQLTRQQLEKHKQEVVDILDLKDVIAHITVLRPFEDQHASVNQQTEMIVEDHYRIISRQDMPCQQIKQFQYGEEIIRDLDEIEKCLLHKLFRPAISSIAVAMENAFIIRLLKENKDIRKEERNGKNWFLPNLNKEAYREFNLITDKTFERINILNKLRRFGTHSKTGTTLEDDALFAFNSYKQALIEMFN